MIARGTRAMRNIGVTYEITARADTHSKVERLKHSRVAGICWRDKEAHRFREVNAQHIKISTNIISYTGLLITQGKKKDLKH